MPPVTEQDPDVGRRGPANSDQASEPVRGGSRRAELGDGRRDGVRDLLRVRGGREARARGGDDPLLVNGLVGLSPDVAEEPDDECRDEQLRHVPDERVENVRPRGRRHAP